MKKIFLFLCLILSSFMFLSFSWESYHVFASSDITSTDFTVPVDAFSPIGTWLIQGRSTENINNLLVRIISALIIFFGVAAAFIMTIGAGYMIIYHGQDELLSKWKSIFLAGIIALVVALSAGIIVRLFTNILYS